MKQAMTDGLLHLLHPFLREWAMPFAVPRELVLTAVVYHITAFPAIRQMP